MDEYNIIYFLVLTTMCTRINRLWSLTPQPDISRCSERNKYLEAAFSCQPDDFYVNTICQGGSVELKCPKATFIAVYVASFGWSNAVPASSSCLSGNTYYTECPMQCVTSRVIDRCQGRRRCHFSAAEEILGNPCHSTSIKYLYLIHTCVPKSVVRRLDDEELINPCRDTVGSGHVFGNHFPQITQSTTTTTRATLFTRWSMNGPSTRLPTTGSSSSTTTTVYGYLFDRQENDGIVVPMNTGLHTTDQNRKKTTEEPDYIFLQSLSDFVLSWRFANDNKEKFVLYVMLALSLGTISILLAIILQMLLPRRRRTSTQSKPNPLITTSWKVPEMESSIGTTDPALTEDEVELTSYNNIGSLPKISSHHQYHYHHTKPDSSITDHERTAVTSPIPDIRPPSSVGYQERPTATINKTYNQCNGRMSNGGFSQTAAVAPSVNGYSTLYNRPTVDPSRTSALRSSHPNGYYSLGRTYSNPYGKDFYYMDSAGVRTLQHQYK